MRQGQFRPRQLRVIASLNERKAKCYHRLFESTGLAMAICNMTSIVLPEITKWKCRAIDEMPELECICNETVLSFHVTLWDVQLLIQLLSVLDLIVFWFDFIRTINSDNRLIARCIIVS